MKFVTAGTVTATLSFAAIMAGMFGKGGLATFLQDPSTAQTVLVLAGSVGTLIAGALKGMHTPAA